jgi:hypothetical protein
VVPIAWLANVSEAGVTATAPIAVPLSVTVCAVVPTVKARLPVRAPATVGVKVTLKVQDAEAASEVPQVVVRAKSPVIETPLTASATVALFLTVTTLAALVVAST